MLSHPVGAVGGNSVPTAWLAAMTKSKSVRRILTILGEFAAHPVAFVLVAAFGVAWIVLEPGRFDFAAGAAMATWFMTLLIQRSEQRDEEALHAKLDEILRALPGADHRLAGLDQAEVEDVVDHREQQAQKPREV